ncbi:MAG: hypothetical protein JNJ77_11910 [Planctomycetia bacterium]|nr:hypothetical protein [Planctomycetia bacterium]
MLRCFMMLALLSALAGCSSKEKLEVPKDTKPAPTTPPINMGGGAGPAK